MLRPIPHLAKCRSNLLVCGYDFLLGVMPQCWCYSVKVSLGEPDCDGVAAPQ
jgi:hypothetical protein